MIKEYEMQFKIKTMNHKGNKRTQRGDCQNCQTCQRSTKLKNKTYRGFTRMNADQKNLHTGNNETQGMWQLFSIEALNAFRLQFFRHFAEGFHNQLRLVKVDPVGAVGGDQMPPMQRMGRHRLVLRHTHRRLVRSG